MMLLVSQSMGLQYSYRDPHQTATPLQPAEHAHRIDDIQYDNVVGVHETTSLPHCKAKWGIYTHALKQLNDHTPTVAQKNTMPALQLQFI